ncbi:MAG: M48 family metallopeptidase, partial [Candidatus Hydrogenedentes bacterium]|nr:M48 family metallopeptidase [Candidatus Hydrogenedentota bacterium]
MWEQIRSNKRKSILLIVLIALVLSVLGGAIGEAVAPRGGGLLGLAVALVVWFVLCTVAYFQGGRIMLAANGAHKISQQDHPQLWNIVEEMTIASGLPRMPDIYLMDDMTPNAFATGRDPDHAAVAVTAGLLAKLNRDQLQGVIAHELGHIKNRDILFMTLMGATLGAIVIISETFLRSLFSGGMHGSRYRSRRSSSDGNDGGQIIMVVIALAIAILAPILAQLIYFAASRRREYLADASGAIFTRYPEGLASALEVISGEAG